MRVIPIVAVTFAALSLTTTGARADGTWCAYYGQRINCGFHSFEQCRASVSGGSEFCQRNPFSSYAAEPRRRHGHNLLEKYQWKPK